MSGKKHSILIVDDVEFNRRMLVDLLRTKGISAQMAASGQEAIELCEQDSFDVILMDVNMPVMDGLETTRHVRNLKDTPSADAFIVGVSAHSSQQDHAFFVEAGMDACLAKPIDLDQLLNAIEQAGSRKFEFTGPMSETRTGDAAILDVAGVLKRVGGNRELFLRFVEIYREDSVSLLQKLQDAMNQSDRNQLGSVAHRLRGIAVNLGAVALSETAGQLENLCLDQSVADSSLLQQLEHVKVQAILLEDELGKLG